MEVLEERNRLISLSDDCLAEIMAFLAPHDLAKLYFCGCSIMCYRMSQRTVHCFSLELAPWNFRTPPSNFISYFTRLSTFHLSARKDVNSQWRIMIDPLLSQLPPTMTEISLKGNFPSKLGILPFFPHLRVLEIATTHKLQSSLLDHQDFAQDIPSQLQKLVICCLQLPTNFLAQLPNSLTHLEVKAYLPYEGDCTLKLGDLRTLQWSVYKTSLVLPLPPHLKRLSFNEETEFNDIFNNQAYPGPLEHLEWLQVPNLPLAASDLQGLPHTLLSFQVAPNAKVTTSGINSCRMFTMDDASAMPPNLTFLHVLRIQSRAIAHLPSSLTHLGYLVMAEQIEDDQQHSIVANFGTPQCLPNLTRLFAQSCGVSHTIPLIPPTLRHAHIGYVLPEFPIAESTKLEFLKLSIAFPASYSEKLSKIPEIMSPHWPISLTTLKLRISFPRLLRPSFGPLQHCHALKSLKLHMNWNMEEKEWESYITEHVYDAFPENLTFLDLRAPFLPHNRTFPHRLKSLLHLKEKSIDLQPSKTNFVNFDRLPDSLVTYKLETIGMVDSSMMSAINRLKALKKIKIFASHYTGSFDLPWYRSLLRENSSIKEFHWGNSSVPNMVDQLSMEKYLVTECKRMGLFLTFPLVKVVRS